MKIKLRQLLCKLFGHRPRTFTSVASGLRASVTSCRRCYCVLEDDERHGQYPLPRSSEVIRL